MKYWCNSTAFQFTWDQVAYAFWLRYPNPYSNHVLTEDTICRQVREDGKLYSKRLITKQSSTKLPGWCSYFMPTTRRTVIVEESIVDPKDQSVITYTRNIGLNHIALLEEKCIYQTNLDDRASTMVHRHCFVSSGVRGFAQAIQSFLVERFKKNAAKTTKGLEYVLTGMYLKDTEQFQNLKHSLPDKITHALHKYAENSSLLKSEKVAKIKNTARQKAKIAKEKVMVAKDRAKAQVKAKVTVSCESNKSSSELWNVKTQHYLPQPHILNFLSNFAWLLSNLGVGIVMSL